MRNRNESRLHLRANSLDAARELVAQLSERLAELDPGTTGLEIMLTERPGN